MPQTIERAEAGYRDIGFEPTFPQRPDVNDHLIVGLTELARQAHKYVGYWEAAPFLLAEEV